MSKSEAHSSVSLLATIVIPAHNEAEVINACLLALLTDARPGAIEVIVACNGCTDSTARLAREFAASHPDHPIFVVEIHQPSKTAALNAGLELASATPIVFLDADVILDTAGVLSIVAALRRPGVMAASTALNLDMTGLSLLSRSYHRYWQRLPTIVDGLAGRGVYALNDAGLERLGSFPPVVADDRLIDQMFSSVERCIATARSTVFASRTARDLVSRKVRVFAGNNEISGWESNRGPVGSWSDVVREDWSTARDLPTYLGLNAIAKILARRAGSTKWTKDSGSRSETIT